MPVAAAVTLSDSGRTADVTVTRNLFTGALNSRATPAANRPAPRCLDRSSVSPLRRVHPEDSAPRARRSAAQRAAWRRAVVAAN
ncbi:MAG: hypothetical protein R2854_02200 [Caldilineaceae bacterium]